jgi:hypothetical protein
MSCIYVVCLGGIVGDVQFKWFYQVYALCVQRVKECVETAMCVGYY